MSFSKRAKFGTIARTFRSKKLVARFYENAAGTKPVREWILSLSREERLEIGTDIQRVEFGWPIGRPVCAPLGSGLWEVRSEIGRNRIARVIFCMVDNEMVLLHGFIKKTQQTPQPELELARKRKKEIDP